MARISQTTVLLFFSLNLMMAIIPSAFGWELPSLFSASTYTTPDPELQNFVNVVKKDGRCSFATLTRARPNAPAVSKEAAASQVHSVKCIGDITIGANTLQEQSGCGAFILNGNTLQTEPMGIYGYGGYQMVPQSCADGGFEKVLAKDVTPYGKLGDYLISTSDFTSESILIYSDNPKYLNWYRKAKAEHEEQIRASFSKYIKSGGYPRYSSGFYSGAGVPYKEIISGEPRISQTGEEGSSLKSVQQLLNGKPTERATSNI